MLKIRWWWGLLLLAVYPIALLSFVWWQCYKSPFENGKNGQLDAYRHTLASAVLAYTASPKLVYLVTNIMEYRGEFIQTMDIHNNALGARIGDQADSLTEIKAKVALSISQGTVNATDAMQSTWLPAYQWRKSLFW